MGAIKFGTDGWRAIIGDQFTFDNLERVTRATAIWLKKTRTERPKVVIGHDLRFQGRAFSEHVARVLIDEGATVLFADTFTTTPAVSWATLEYGCDAGIVITASHNPPAYSGFKIKAAFGGPATPPMTKAVEAEIMDEPAGRPLPKFHELVEDGRVELRDLNTAYLDALRGRLDIEAIRAAGLTVAHDAMYGASQGLVRALLGDDRVVELHAEHNPGFHGQPPEPIERNLGELAEAVVREGCAVGLANDGDADRIG
ncbi:MAG: phosphoglucomutase/phosphomannomutase family protein, partial [Bacteroidota bacterium]